MISDDAAMPGATGETRLDDVANGEIEPAKRLSAAAERALAEAEARRAEREAKVAAMPREIGGRGGEEPVRYGDWERKGLTSDF
jgi:hypothetical protein